MTANISIEQYLEKVSKFAGSDYGRIVREQFADTKGTSELGMLASPTPQELEQMKTLVAQAMADGALGLSSSLQYVPDRFADTDELVELARVAAASGGVYLTHQRSESGRIFESMDEVFAVAERAKIPAEIWHLKTAYKANWGRMPQVLERLEAARARGLDVSANQYPYTRASNGLDACLPLWVREGIIGEGFSSTTREKRMGGKETNKTAAWKIGETYGPTAIRFLQVFLPF